MLISGYLLINICLAAEARQKRDPFVPLVGEGSSVYLSTLDMITNEKDIRLEGIIYDNVKESAAIINGEVVKEGQEVGFIKVLKIEQSGVSLSLEGKTIQINFDEE